MKIQLQKLVSGAIAAIFILGTPLGLIGITSHPASAAEVDIETLKATITQLLQQIKALQEQINALRVEQSEAVSDLLTTLNQGSRGKNVETLQALLASDPELYPEGLITGYYGPLTSRAVQRFQKRHNIEQVGIVGPKTLGKLNDLFRKHPVAFEDDDDEDENEEDNDNRGRLCAIVPPGHLIAPGWLRKHGKPLVPACQNLPPGILKKLGASPTSTPDTVAPIISNIVASPAAASATITWTTNEPATSQVFYGTTAAYGSNTALDATLLTNHSITAIGLTASTTYHYQIRSADGSGNLTTSTDAVFTTTALPASDTTAPVLSSIVITPSSTTASVSWTTDEPATGKVYYGIITPLDLGSASTTATSSFTTAQAFSLTGLTASTTYYLVLESADTSGNTTTSTEQSFVTF